MLVATEIYVGGQLVGIMLDYIPLETILLDLTINLMVEAAIAGDFEMVDALSELL